MSVSCQKFGATCCREFILSLDMQYILLLIHNNLVTYVLILTVYLKHF